MEQQFVGLFVGGAVTDARPGALALGAIATVAAETAYVTDELEITLRTGETTGHRIVRMLPTGEKLTVLGTNPDSGYSKVRTSNGTVGFVLTRQLVDTPVARDRLAAAEPTLLALERVDPLLAQWLTGLLGIRAQNAEGAYFSYAFGSVSRWGRWWFFPVLLAVTTPIVLLLAAVVAVTAITRGAAPTPLVSRHWWPPAVTASVYLAAAITSNYNLGFRHLLPVLPFLILPVAVWLGHRPRAALAAGLDQVAQERRTGIGSCTG